MNGYLVGIVAVGLTTSLSVIGLHIVRKHVSLATLLTYHEVAGYLLSVVGTLYAVLLGFVVVDAMQHMQDVRGLVSMEATGLANIYLCSEGLPNEDKMPLHQLCHRYAEEVIDDEWNTLSEGKYSQKTFHTAFQIWKAIAALNPKTTRQQNIHEQLLDQVCLMTQNHRSRVISATHGVAPVMWVVLITGGVFTMIFTYFFGMSNLRIQTIMTILVSMTLSLNLYLVYVFGNPMATDLGVKPGPFRLDLLIFDSFDKGDMPEGRPFTN
jgi:hypothetical protein